jgi:hypothetical protein
LIQSAYGYLLFTILISNFQDMYTNILKIFFKNPFVVLFKKNVKCTNKNSGYNCYIHVTKTMPKNKATCFVLDGLQVQMKQFQTLKVYQRFSNYQIPTISL